MLVTTWNSVHHLQSTRRRTFHCIDANPFLGTLRPGESATAHGCVLLVPEGLDTAWQEARGVVSRAAAG